MLQPIKYLFQALTRKDVPDAPVYDPSFTVWLNDKPIVGAVKTFVDPNPPVNEDPVTYQILNPDYSLGKLVMSAGAAKKLNLPGHPDYPHYSPEASGATLNGSPFPVVSMAEAASLANELGQGQNIGTIIDPMATFTGNFAPIYPVGDPRRAFSISLTNGVVVSVSQLLAAKNANGVGSPGQWDQSGAIPVWVADLSAPSADSQILPIPVSIPVGAKIIPPGIGGLASIEVPDAPAPSSGNGGGLTAAQDAILQRLDKWLAKFGA